MYNVIYLGLFKRIFLLSELYLLLPTLVSRDWLDLHQIEMDPTNRKNAKTSDLRFLPKTEFLTMS